MPPIPDREYIFENMRQRRMLSMISRGQFFNSPAIKGGIRRNSPSGTQEHGVTEEQLLAYIMANFPPDLILDPEQGLVDSSGNNVTITTNGTPTLNASGGLNNRGYVSMDGTDDAIISDRVDIGTHAIVFRHNSAGIAILNVPTSNTGTGDSPKFWKQGIVYSGSPSRYTFYPDSGGTIRPVTCELSASEDWRCFVHRGEGYIYNNGQSVFRIKATAVADTTVTKMFYGCWGRGDGANLAQFTQYDLGLSMIWNAALTDEQLHILHAYLELRYNSYGKVTYQYIAEELELEPNNPVFAGNEFSDDDYEQSYPVKVLPSGHAIYKSATKDMYGSSATPPDFLTWTDQPRVLETGGFNEFDQNGIGTAIYRQLESTYYIIYGGRLNTQYTIGFATSASPLTGYVKHSGNPIIDLDMINVPLEKEYTLLYPMDWKIINGTHHLFIIGTNLTSETAIILLTGDSLTTLANPRIILDWRDTFMKPDIGNYSNNRDDSGLPTDECFMALGGIHRIGGGKIAGLICWGNQGDQLTTARSMVILPIVADDDNQFNFKTVAGISIDTGGDNTWNKTQSYYPDMVLVQDGEWMTPFVHNNKWIIPFAGLGTTEEDINTHGFSGFAYAPKKLITHISEIIG
jgi:hypothetical protein